MPMHQLYRILFVCMGNICRSPTAHGVLRAKLAAAGWAGRIEVDSAGTLDYHAGAPPDARSQQHARRRGYDLSDLRARALTALDFERADWLLVMDDENFDTATQRCPAQHRHKIVRLTTFCRTHRADEVPDPYTGGAAGFEHVLDLIEDACDGLLAHVQGLPSRGEGRFD